MVLACAGALASVSFALDRSRGPGTSGDTIGPVGARLELVYDIDFFGLDGDFDGDPIFIGQAEPGEPLAIHEMLDGIVTRRNSTAPSQHATGVASILVGQAATIPVGISDPNVPAGLELEGVAPGALLFSSGYTSSNDAFFAFDWLIDVRQVDVINQSAGVVDHMAANGNTEVSLFADMRIYQDDVIWINALGNEGPNPETTTLPGDAYNVISVGYTGAQLDGGPHPFDIDYARMANGSSRGPTADGRNKPDLVAPGGSIHMASNGSDADYQIARGTSFSAPHVAGVAALLVEHGLRNDYATDHLAVKAYLMNSASKHVTDPQNGNRAWTETPAATTENIALDSAMGIGQLNALAAVRQMQSTARGDLSSRFGNLTAGETDQHLLVGGATLKRGSLVTATLVWDRPVELTDGADRTQAASYVGTELPDVDLELVRVDTGTVVAASITGAPGSASNSVEHIYFNVPDDGPYRLQVRNESVQFVEDYVLAFSAGTSDGIAFSVDGGHFNSLRNDPSTMPDRPANMAEGLAAPYGNNPFPNDVNALGGLGPANFPTEGEIFVSSRDGTNMQRLSGALGTQSRVGPHNAPPAAIAVLDESETGVLGLRPNDNITSLSWGTDGTQYYDEDLDDYFFFPSVLVFSVDTDADGAVDSAVNFESTLSPPDGTAQKPYPDNPGGGSTLTHGGEAAGDIFKSGQFGAFGETTKESALQLAAAPAGTNVRLVDEADLGLQAPRHNEGGVFVNAEDDLNALEWENPLDRVDPDGDGQHSMPVFFTLGPDSPTVVDPFNGITADDVLVSTGPGQVSLFSGGGGIGLLPGDVIDALAVSDILEPGVLDYIGVDTALFSLAPGSPTLLTYGLSPADIFWTDFAHGFFSTWDPTLTYDEGGNLFATAEELGLLPTDNLNALDVFYDFEGAEIPEPSGLVLLSLGMLCWSVTSRRRYRRSR